MVYSGFTIPFTSLLEFMELSNVIYLRVWPLFAGEGLITLHPSLSLSLSLTAKSGLLIYWHHFWRRGYVRTCRATVRRRRAYNSPPFSLSLSHGKVGFTNLLTSLLEKGMYVSGSLSGRLCCPYGDLKTIIIGKVLLPLIRRSKINNYRQGFVAPTEI